MSGKKVVILGGAGFIGIHLLDQLILNGIEVTIIDSFEPQIHGSKAQIETKINSIKAKCNLRVSKADDLNVLMAEIPGSFAVVNLVAETGTGQSMYELSKYSHSNIQSTAVLWELIAKLEPVQRPLRFVQASSRAVYGEGKYSCENHGFQFPKSREINSLKILNFEPTCPICSSKLIPESTDEDSSIQISSVYGLTKYAQEQICKLMAKPLGVAGISFRFQNVYGPGQSLRNPYTGLLAVFFNRLVQNMPLNVFEDGKPERDFVYVTDCVDAICDALDEKLKLQGNEIVNIGTGIGTTVLQIAETMKQYLDSDSKIEITGAFRLGDIRRNRASISLAQSLLNYSPKVSLEQGLSWFMEWAKLQEPEADRFEPSMLEMVGRGLASLGTRDKQ